MKAAMNAACRVAALVCLTLLLRGEARAEYCPIAFYGYMNGCYMFYCHSCDSMGGCLAVGVAAGHMYSCGGDEPCCTPGSSCLDPIPPGDIKVCEVIEGEKRDQSQGKDQDEGAKPAAKKTATAAMSCVPTEIGHVQQSGYVSPSEKFRVPGAHITIKEEYVSVTEADGSASYFRLITASWVGHMDRTLCFGMEMDPGLPPKQNPDGSALSKAIRKAKPGVYQHTVTVRGHNYDASSVRDLNSLKKAP